MEMEAVRSGGAGNDAPSSAGRAGQLSRMAVAEMERRGIAPTPTNYCIWYCHLDGTHPRLSEDILDIERRGGRFDFETSETLFQRHFVDQFHEAKLRELGEDLSGNLDWLIGRIGEADRDAAQYGERLETVSDQLTEPSGGSRAPLLLRQLIEDTRSMRERNRSLEGELKRSSDQVQQLKDNLVQAQTEALTDALTGIANRKCFDQTLIRVGRQARAEGTELALAMIDIDHFKFFNDRHGHRLGDQVLRIVGSLLKEATPEGALAARYGGEEFVLLLPGMGLAGATELVDGIRERLAAQHIRQRSTGEVLGSVTFSAGIAVREASESVERLVGRADIALYAAKQAGRNRVRAFAA